MRSRSAYAIVLVVGAVVLSSSLLVGFQVYKDDVADRSRADVQRSATQVRSELDARLAGHRESVRLWARNDAVASHGQPGQRAALRAFVDSTAFSGVSVVAENGTMTAIVAGLSPERRRRLVGSDFGNRTYFERAMAGETYVSEPIQAESGNYIVTISTPIRRDGEIVGTLNGAFHVSDAPLFESVADSLGPDERMIVRSGTGEQIYAGSAVAGDAPFAWNATLRQTDWVVTVQQSTVETRALLRQTTYLQFGSLALVIVSFAAFGWWNYRRNLRQVERLLDGFDALERKEYGSQIDIGGAQEWTRIGTAFNEMSRTLERYFTARERRERQLQVLDRVLRHDLRNGMNVVRGHAEAIVASDDDATAHARKILAASDSLLALAETERLINDLFQRDPEPAPVEVGPIVDRAVDSVARAYPAATITVDYPASVTALAIDRLETAVTELVENGVAHTDSPTPSVRVTVTEAGDEVRIAVADEGGGIPEMERQIIRGEQAIDPLSHSGGLGLWLVSLVADLSEGDLSFEDTEGGSVVTIHLQAPPAGT